MGEGFTIWCNFFGHSPPPIANHVAAPTMLAPSVSNLQLVSMSKNPVELLLLAAQPGGRPQSLDFRGAAPSTGWESSVPLPDCMILPSNGPPHYNAGAVECSLIDNVVEVVRRRDVGGSGNR